MVAKKALGVLQKVKRMCGFLTVINELTFGLPLEPSHSQQTLWIVWKESVRFPKQYHGGVCNLTVFQQPHAAEEFDGGSRSRLLHTPAPNGFLHRASDLGMVKVLNAKLVSRTRLPSFGSTSLGQEALFVNAL